MVFLYNEQSILVVETWSRDLSGQCHMQQIRNLIIILIECSFEYITRAHSFILTWLLCLNIVWPSISEDRNIHIIISLPLYFV